MLVAYREQYRRDLSTFLKSRSEEMVIGGRMVLTFVGGSFDDDVSKEEGTLQFTLLANTLADMVTEVYIYICMYVSVYSIHHT